MSSDQNTPESVRERIIHVLTIYHVISPSMLQTGLGPSVPAAAWRPVLEKLIEEEVVDRDHIIAASPLGRHNPYTRLRLSKPVIMVK